MKRQRKSISCSFSTDLISEILLRLPEKSVVMFRCVSKLWLSITTDPYFINLFETRNHRPNLLICFKQEDDFIVSSIPQHSLALDQNSIKSYVRPAHTYRMKFTRNYSFVTESVHGLICLRSTSTGAVIVWNPRTSKFLTLPKPSKSWNNIRTYLGYDPVEAKHKVIAINSGRTCTMCGVITLGSAQESWRIVKTNPKHTPFNSNGFGQCIKGVIYYLAYTYRTYQCVWVIMRFDVRSEKLDTIQLSSDIQVDRLISYEGRLACVYIKDGTKEYGFTLLILEDNKWSSKDFLAPLYHHDESLRIKFQLKGLTHHAGEFIYGPYSVNEYRKYLNVLFFDPVRNSFRRVAFRGISDDEHEGCWWGGHVRIFPNHIESQMSL